MENNKINKNIIKHFKKHLIKIFLSLNIILIYFNSTNYLKIKLCNDKNNGKTDNLI